MSLTRRDLGRLALASVPMAGSAAISSKFHGVQIGAITYSFRSISDVEEIIRAMVKLGLSEVELMSNHAELLAGAPASALAPPGGGRDAKKGPPAPGQAAARRNTPEARKAREELRQWRLSASMDKFKGVRKKFTDAGIDIHLLCFNMNDATTDDEIDYAFQMAKALDAEAMSSTTQVSVSKRVAPFADKHKLMVGFHNHANIKDPNEFATPESFAAAMSYSKYHGVNLDIGHFTAADYDALAYIRQHYRRITNLHLKDRKKNQGANLPWGQGDTPIKEVLQLMKKEKYKFPANIEYEYRVEGADTVTEVGKCLQFCKDALA